MTGRINVFPLPTTTFSIFMARFPSKPLSVSCPTGSPSPSVCCKRESSTDAGNFTSQMSFLSPIQQCQAAPSGYTLQVTNTKLLLLLLMVSIRQKYTSICITHFYAKRLKCAQTWITQFYLQITPYLPLFSSRRTSPSFGWYSFYRPTEGKRLGRPGWLVTYRNKVPPPGVEHGHPSQY